jgi:uncharacterized iron-regulated membrane protein
VIRKVLFWLHLCAGVAAGLFIFIMAATGFVLSFEKTTVEFLDRDIRSILIPQDAKQQGMNGLLEAVRRGGASSRRG